MNSIKKQARVAGLWYLVLAITAPIGLMIPSEIMVPGDATATADHVRASETLLRMGIGSELFYQIIAIFLVLALYRLFKGVSKKHAVLMVILGALVSAPIVFVNVLNEIAALILVGSANFLSVFDKPQLDALAYLFMRLHSQGTRDGHTLAHSSRKLMRKLVFKAVETDKIDVVPREFLALVRGQPLHFETEGNVL